METAPPSPPPRGCLAKARCMKNNYLQYFPSCRSIFLKKKMHVSGNFFRMTRGKQKNKASPQPGANEQHQFLYCLHWPVKCLQSSWKAFLFPMHALLQLINDITDRFLSLFLLDGEGVGRVKLVVQLTGELKELSSVVKSFGFHQESLQ